MVNKIVKCYVCGRQQGVSKLKFYLTRNTPDNSLQVVCYKHKVKRHYNRKPLTKEQKIINALNSYFKGV